MFKNNKKEKFSLRKYKDGRTDSKLIGATLLVSMGLLASGGTALANVSSNGTDTATMVTDTSKVASTAATTFTDDKDATKTVKVNAVLGKGTAEPTKANNNAGDADGTDTLNVKSEATVNYKLYSDKSLLKSETVEAGTGIVKTPYDKKGLAYDTDGKDYRESTLTQLGTVVSKDTGKKDTVEANGKVYEYAGKSEVEGVDKLTYDKTRFNDIEAPVSPEGMHNKLGEIDYTKITGKVYLVEETADGQYGKFVEANGVTSDEDAVAKWKAGEATAKDFTKANVTLKEGDTVLVLDKDTFITGEGERKQSVRQYETATYVALDEINNVKNYEIENLAAVTYIFDVHTSVTEELKTIGVDRVFGTADDVSETVANVTTLSYSSFKEENGIDDIPDTPTLDNTRASVKDILKDIQSTGLRSLELLGKYAKKDADKEKISEKISLLDSKVSEIEEMIKTNNIGVGLKNGDVVFYHTDSDLISKLKDQLLMFNKRLEL